jgi:hypothetical protein
LDPQHPERRQRAHAELGRARVANRDNRGARVRDGRGCRKIRNEPPSSSELAPIVKSLRRWLISNEYRHRRMLVVAGFSFIALRTIEGTHADLVPVTPSTNADCRHVWDAINDKISRYRKVVAEEELPFVVVLSSEEGAGLDHRLVEGALHGDNSVSLTFGAGTFGPMEPRRVEMRQTSAPPVFDSCLSAVGWIEVVERAETQLTMWPIAAARRRVAAIEGPSINVVRQT